jgi:hypothetical protein
MDWVSFEAITVIVWLVMIFGFYDRIFFLISAIVGFFFSAIAMNDGVFVLDQVYNPNTSTWITYTISVYPDIIMMAIPVIVSTLILIVKLGQGTEEAILF